jgi:magnesium chelatase family protein
MVGTIRDDGIIVGYRGALPVMLAARRMGVENFAVAVDNLPEARLVAGARLFPVENIAELRQVLSGTREPEDWQVRTSETSEQPDVLTDASRIYGMLDETTRYAVLVAAAGSHHIVLDSYQATQNADVAKLLAELLPDLTVEESELTTALYSSAGYAPHEWMTRPPLVSPPSTATVAALIGGGSGGSPGAVSLAHGGILHLADIPKFSVSALDALRRPMDEKSVSVKSHGGTVKYPAGFQLVASMAPCPCGHKENCTDTPLAIRRHSERISGPILDRIEVMASPRQHSGDLPHSDPKLIVALRDQIRDARDRSLAGLKNTPWVTSSQIPGGDLTHLAAPRPDAAKLLEEQLRLGRITVRSADRTLRVAWTIATLNHHDRVTADDIHTALDVSSYARLRNHATSSVRPRHVAVAGVDGGRVKSELVAAERTLGRIPDMFRPESQPQIAFTPNTPTRQSLTPSVAR